MAPATASERRSASMRPPLPAGSARIILIDRHLSSQANMHAISRRADSVSGAVALALCLLCAPLLAQTSSADKLIDGALEDSAAWNRLAELVDTFGNRPVGSAS